MMDTLGHWFLFQGTAQSEGGRWSTHELSLESRASHILPIYHGTYTWTIPFFLAWDIWGFLVHFWDNFV